MRKRDIWPDLISLGNLFIGFWAIIKIQNQAYHTAAWLIIVAATLDGLDGAVARLVRRSGRMGVEVDSLVDLVSFGVAPSLLIYSVVLQPLGTVGILLAFLPLLFGMLRLARFNILTVPSRRKHGFIGLPITGSALILASFFIYLQAVGSNPTDPRIWFTLIAANSLVMISPIPYRRFPVVKVAGSRHPLLGGAVLTAGLLAVLYKPALAIFPLMLLYLLLGPAEWSYRQLHKLLGVKPESDDTEPVYQHRRRRNR